MVSACSIVWKVGAEFLDIDAHYVRPVLARLDEFRSDDQRAKGSIEPLDLHRIGDQEGVEEVDELIDSASESGVAREVMLVSEGSVRHWHA
jgi:hypothetical protein